MPMPCNSHWAEESEPAWWVDVIPSKVNKGNAVWILWWLGLPWSRCSDHQDFKRAQNSPPPPPPPLLQKALEGPSKEPQSGKHWAKLGWGVQLLDIPCSPSHFLIGKASCRRVSVEGELGGSDSLASCVILGGGFPSLNL